MKKAKTAKTAGKFLVMLLVLSMLLSNAAMIFAAEEDAGKAADGSAAAVDNSHTLNSLADMAELMVSTSYEEYHLRHENAPLGTGEIVIPAAEYDAENTLVDVEILSDYDGKKGDSILTPEEGKVAWKVEIPKTGFYNISVSYYPYEGKSASAERIVMIDGKVPFKEARYITFSRIWKDNYIEPGKRVFKTDVNNNEIRPSKSEAPEWRDYALSDSSAFYPDPFEFYLEEGTHIITMDATREPLLLNEIRIHRPESLKTYEQTLAEYEKKGYQSASKDISVKIDAEIPLATSEQVIYPVNDRTSPITDPQDPSIVTLNSIGGDKWQIAGQWIQWEVDIPESGLYQIVPRFKQSLNSGMFSSRSIRIDGEYPFAEAKFLQFNYEDNWQVKPLNDGETEFVFYFEKGKHVIEMEVVLGKMAETLRSVDESLVRMNEYYRKILMITGPNPDSYLDYDFAKLIPEVLRGMRTEAEFLYGVSADMVEIIGEKGENSVTLDRVAYLLDVMGHDQDKVASNLSNFKSYIGSLGTWLLSTRNQPVQLDYIQIQPQGASMPRENANFFEAFWHEFRSFIMSFFTDYDSLGATQKYDDNDHNVVEVWVTFGRDQMQIMRQMVDDSFTQKVGIPVNLKLIAAGTLLPATLAGVGPDVSMDADPVSYGIRNAVRPLDEFEDFDEIKSWFNPETFVPLTIYDPDQGGEVTYGLPSQLSFPMLFYRKDIFVDLGLDVPETWDDIYDVIRALSENNMSMGFSQAMTQILMYQQNEPWYTGDTPETLGIETNLGSNTALDAFETMCNLFTMYRQPVTYDFANRFRTGEMPIGIADYSLYNQLKVFAPEISGLWEFVQLPGTPQEDGTINHTSPLTVSAVMMMRDAKNTDNAWEFMKWWVGAEAQSRFGNEQVAILGTAAKYNTANTTALEAQPWTAQELRNLRQQFSSLKGTPMVPGQYIVARYTNFAFYNVYDDGDSPSEAMLGYVDDINNELTRKRAEYDYITADELKAGLTDQK